MPRKTVGYDEYLAASGISKNQFHKIVAEIRKEIGVKSKRQPRYI